VKILHLALKVILSVIYLLVITSCADENLKQPTELEPFASNYQLDVVWQDELGKGVEEQYLFLEPLILGENAVTVGRDGQLSVIDMDSGDVIYQQELDSQISAGVGGDEKTWVVSTEDADVIAIDAKTHTIHWRTHVPTEVLARPVIGGNNVIVRTVDGRVIAINRDTGKIRWQYQRTIPDLTLRGNSVPLITRDKIFVGMSDGRLVALSPDTGEVVWDVALAVPEGRSEIQRLVDIDGDMVLYGRILYAVSYQGRLAAIDVDRGQFLWARDFSSNTGLAVDKDALYLTDENGQVWALDRNNGATIWKQDKLLYRKLTRPALIGDYLAVGDFEGYIHILSRYDGHFVARHQLGQFDDIGWQRSSGIIVPPATQPDNRLVVVNRGSIAYVLQLKKKVPLDF
jgi:outer membrane protein assembly factor BamB